MEATKPRAGVCVVGERKLRIHPLAQSAFQSWMALPETRSSAELPPAILFDLIAQSMLVVVVKAENKSADLHVVGGFRVFRWITALRLLGQRPERIIVREIEDRPVDIRRAVQIELVSALLSHLPRDSGAGIVAIAKLLSRETCLSIFGKEKPDRRSLSKLTGLHLRDLVEPKALASPADSSILASLLAGRK